MRVRARPPSVPRCQKSRLLREPRGFRVPAGFARTLAFARDRLGFGRGGGIAFPLFSHQSLCIGNTGLRDVRRGCRRFDAGCSPITDIDAWCRIRCLAVIAFLHAALVGVVFVPTGERCRRRADTFPARFLVGSHRLARRGRGLNLACLFGDGTLRASWIDSRGVPVPVEMPDLARVEAGLPHWPARVLPAGHVDGDEVFGIRGIVQLGKRVVTQRFACSRKSLRRTDAVLHVLVLSVRLRPGWSGEDCGRRHEQLEGLTEHGVLEVTWFHLRFPLRRCAVRRMHDRATCIATRPASLLPCRCAKPPVPTRQARRSRPSWLPSAGHRLRSGTSRPNPSSISECAPMPIPPVPVRSRPTTRISVLRASISSRRPLASVLDALNLGVSRARWLLENFQGCFLPAPVAALVRLGIAGASWCE